MGGLEFIFISVIFMNIMAMFVFLLLFSSYIPFSLAKIYEADVVIYGGTSGAVMAGVQVARMGKCVIMVSPDKHLGGLTSGGLGWTDNGHAAGIGGLSLEFYQGVKQHYEKPGSWRQETQEEYREHKRPQGRNRKGDKSMWVFEPHVAEMLMEDFISKHDIEVVRDAWLDREKGVEMKGGKIVAMTTLSGDRYVGKVFIDATYEGDLMAAAGVGFHVGRESNGVYGETSNGVQKGRREHEHYFATEVSPYKVPGDAKSGLLAGISAEAPGENGTGDKKIQAYCFRACLTNAAENRIPFAKPEGYDPDRYLLILRVYESGWNETFRKFDLMPNRKTDQNNHGPFSTDHIGANYDYPEASYERRREIIKEHESYQKGLMYFMANDPRVPEGVRKEMSEWGLPKDEFMDNGNWSHQLYIREARRMIGEYVMTEHDCLGRTKVEESIGLGVYTMDSHHVQRYVTAEGFVQNEGDVGLHIKKPYGIEYGAILPKREDVRNLIVPMALSSSHIAFGSIRMEPTFMILGQSAGAAAGIAVEKGVDVQDVDYEKDLKPRLLADGQRLVAPVKKRR